MPKKSSQSFESDTFSVHAADIESATEQDSDPDSAYYTTYPNRWARIKHPLREYVAEFLGTAVLVIFGTGVDCQVVLSTNPQVASSPRGIYLSISFGWGIATALGVWCAGGISGGHINPAVTLALAVFRDFPWRKVPGYIFSQILGGCIGACLVYATYFHAIDIFEGGRGIRTPGTASLFITFPLDYMPSVSCFFDEFFGTALLLIVILAITDKRNSPPPAGLVPLVLFFLVTGEGASLGMQTAYAINPARDLGPRIMTYMVGYGTEVWNYRNQYWLWVPFLGPIAGGLVGTAFYDAFLYTGSDSIFNRPNKQARLHHARSTKQATEKVPAGVHE